MDMKYLPTTDEGKLVHLIEECGETIQAATKVLRFGLHNSWDMKRNDRRLVEEIEDLCYASEAVIEIVKAKHEAGGTSGAGQADRTEARKIRGKVRDGLRARPRSPNLRDDRRG